MKNADTIIKREILIPVDGVKLSGILTLPEDAIGLVIFSHGSGSSRLSPRNNYVADILNKDNIGTLLFDLLTEDEDETYTTRFDIQLLSTRLINVTKWLKKQSELSTLSFGYFGASTGAASALVAASHLKNDIKAVVSRGGRPDLALGVLGKVEAPVLLIVGGADTIVIKLNEKAYSEIKSYKELSIVDGATHLFEEPGKLQEAANMAASWFTEFL